jgi:uncharacterized protein YoxC
LMSTVAPVSLAVIAATCVISVAALVVFLVYLRRVLGRVEGMLRLLEAALPDLLRNARDILTRVDRDVLGEVVRTVEQVSAAVGSGLTVFGQVQMTARRLALGLLVPRVANAAGVLSAIREGLNWLRPVGNGRRR